MHCPNCGKNAAETQKFCRSCGFKLEKVAELLIEQRESPEPLPPQMQRTEQMVGLVINTMLGMMAVGVVAAIVYFVMIRQGAFWTGLGFIGFLTWVIVLMTLIGKWTDLQNAKAARRQPLPDKLPLAEDTARLLAENSVFGQSVTDRTTDLLEVPAQRKRSGELHN